MQIPSLNILNTGPSKFTIGIWIQPWWTMQICLGFGIQTLETFHQEQEWFYAYLVIHYISRVTKTFFLIGQINDPLGPNATLFRRDIDNSTLADHILFDHYQVGRYLQLQKTSGRFMIAEIEMTFANICKHHKFRTWYSYSHFIFYLKFSSRSNASSQRLL